MSRAKSREQTHARSVSSRDSVFRRQRMTYESPSPTGNASPGKVFAIAAMGVFLAALDLFIVNAAFPAIQRDFSGSSVSDVSWMLNVYAIVFAALLVSAGQARRHPRSSARLRRRAPGLRARLGAFR